MGLVSVMIGASIIVSLRRFAKLARDISMPEREAGSFAEANRVPELAAVARDFDGMVRRLEESREGVRAMVKATAQAFDPPLSAISRSIDPIRRGLRPDDQRARRALETIRAAESRMRALMAASAEMAGGDAVKERPSQAGDEWERFDFAELIQELVRGRPGTRTVTQNWDADKKDRGEGAPDEAAGADAPDVHVIAPKAPMREAITALLSIVEEITADKAQSQASVMRDDGDAILDLKLDLEAGSDAGCDLKRLFTQAVPMETPSAEARGVGHSGNQPYHDERATEIVRWAKALGGTLTIDNDPSGRMHIRVRLPIGA